MSREHADQSRNVSAWYNWTRLLICSHAGWGQACCKGVEGSALSSISKIALIMFFCQEIKKIFPDLYLLPPGKAARVVPLFYFWLPCQLSFLRQAQFMSSSLFASPCSRHKAVSCGFKGCNQKCSSSQRPWRQEERRWGSELSRRIHCKHSGKEATASMASAFSGYEPCSRGGSPSASRILLCLSWPHWAAVRQLGAECCAHCLRGVQQRSYFVTCSMVAKGSLTDKASVFTHYVVFFNDSHYSQFESQLNCWITSPACLGLYLLEKVL